MTGGLFQIQEPDAGREAPSARAPGRGIGIDLGTTHSLVCIAPNGADPRALDVDGRALVPSVVAYLDGEPLVGRVARERAAEHPTRVLSSIKRFMGRGPEDIEFAHPYSIVRREHDAVVRIDVGRDQPVSPVEVSAEILSALKRRAELELNGPVAGAVITVPAYFDDAQRQATRDAGRVAGLEVYRLLAEPTAAAIAYGLDTGGQGLFAVYDLGGGTFDVSILRLKDGVFHVLATGGDSALGGDDFDRALAEATLLKEVESPSASQLQVAHTAARALKERLSDATSVVVDVPELGVSGVELTRATLDSILEPIVRRTHSACRRALEDAGVRARELDGVVLVGGSTRIPLVRAHVERLFRQKPLSDLDPDRVVAYGAAITADLLSGSPREGMTLLDVVPLSLGLETMGGIVEKIIPRNATIPIAARQVFTNYSERQTGMTVHVVQGERELASDCRSLARFDLGGMPALPPGMARVEITFQVDADALLTVTATELMTGTRQRVAVKPTYGLSGEEVDRLVMDSLDHARDDFAARALAEARVELGRVVLAVRTAYDEVGHLDALLPEPERGLLLEALTHAEAVMAGTSPTEDHRGLDDARKRLEASSEDFARRRMERALESGMGGKTLAQIELALAEEDALDRKRGSHTAETVD
jgi:molecular chaperone HscA